MFVSFRFGSGGLRLVWFLVLFAFLKPETHLLGGFRTRNLK